jgi:SNF2 family DNA or RNA helicase
VNPGILGELATFKRVFQGPVESGCDAKATPAVKQLARDRALELAAVAAKVRQRAATAMDALPDHAHRVLVRQHLNLLAFLSFDVFKLRVPCACARAIAQFIIRRTSELLAKHLPPKHEMVVFAKCTQLQRALYMNVLRTPEARSLAARGRDESAASLVLIGTLRKICLHPALVYRRAQGAAGGGGELSDVDEDEAADADVVMGEASEGGGGGGGSGGGGGGGVARSVAATGSDMAGALELFPSGFNAAAASPEVSCKMALLLELLTRVKAASSDRFVIVSNFTVQLD